MTGAGIRARTKSIHAYPLTQMFRACYNTETIVKGRCTLHGKDCVSVGAIFRLVGEKSTVYIISYT